MNTYRGFDLVECICLSPPWHFGERSVIIRDDLVGNVEQFENVSDAKAWIDRKCAVADKMLEAVW